jgi:hypothetical protein
MISTSLPLLLLLLLSLLLLLLRLLLLLPPPLPPPVAAVAAATAVADDCRAYKNGGSVRVEGEWEWRDWKSRMKSGESVGVNERRDER